MHADSKLLCAFVLLGHVVHCVTVIFAARRSDILALMTNSC